MVQEHHLETYALFADVEAMDAQNPQELASIWGDIRSQFEEIGAGIEASYATFGRFDFLVIVTAPSRDVALRASLILGRHGLDVETMGAIPTEEFASIVSDA